MSWGWERNEESEVTDEEDDGAWENNNKKIRNVTDEEDEGFYHTIVFGA